MDVPKKICIGTCIMFFLNSLIQYLFYEISLIFVSCKYDGTFLLVLNSFRSYCNFFGIRVKYIDVYRWCIYLCNVRLIHNLFNFLVCSFTSTSKPIKDLWIIFLSPARNEKVLIFFKVKLFSYFYFPVYQQFLSLQRYLMFAFCPYRHQPCCDTVPQ